MIEQIERVMRRIFHKTGTRFIRSQQGFEPRYGRYFILLNFRPATNRHDKIVRKSAQIGRGGLKILMSKTAKRLVRQIVLLHPMKMIDHRHTAPTDPQCGMHMALGPIHHLYHFGPICDVLEVQMLNRSAGDD